jgi:hypothetical protein
MKITILQTLTFGILLVIFSFLPSTSEAQTANCDYGEFCGGGGVVGSRPQILDSMCNSTPVDIVCHPGWPGYVNVTCHDCYVGSQSIASGAWHHAGTSACSNFDKTLVITFSEPVADVDIGIYGARKVTDNRGYTLNLNPTLNSNGFLEQMRVFLPGPGITSITLSDPLEYPVYHWDGSLYDPAVWELKVGGFAGNFWYTPDTVYNQCYCNRPTFARPDDQSVFSPDWNGNGIKDWRMDVEVSEDDGLVLKNVRLENRYMAEQISVPYYILKTATITPAERGELKPNSGESFMASRLVNFNSWDDEEKFVIEATYVVTNIPGGSTNCLEIIQRYEFYRSKPNRKAISWALVRAGQAGGDVE